MEGSSLLLTEAAFSASLPVPSQAVLLWLCLTSHTSGRNTFFFFKPSGNSFGLQVQFLICKTIPLYLLQDFFAVVTVEWKHELG